MLAAAILEKFQMAISPQRLTIYIYSAHRAVIFAIAQLSCLQKPSQPRLRYRCKLVGQYNLLENAAHEARQDGGALFIADELDRVVSRPRKFIVTLKRAW